MMRSWEPPADVMAAHITVPFAPETPASGIGDTGFFRACWYRRSFELRPGCRLANGAPAALRRSRFRGHRLDQRPFGRSSRGRLHAVHASTSPNSCDARAPQTIVVRAEDDPLDLAKPRGKQDWQLEPHSIWYPRTTGIWQTVWLERCPPTWIERMRWTPNLERWEIGFEAWSATASGATTCACRCKLARRRRAARRRHLSR